MRLFALRGANSVEANESSAILEGTSLLIRELMDRNALTTDAMVSCIFTLTDDLDAEFPALAARRLGLDKVPLLCAREIPVPGVDAPDRPARCCITTPTRSTRPSTSTWATARALRSDLDAAQ